jgi:hypothetical protein
VDGCSFSSLRQDHCFSSELVLSSFEWVLMFFNFHFKVPFFLTSSPFKIYLKIFFMLGNG